MFDRKMRYVAVSQRWCKDYGLERDAILGKSHLQIFPNLSESWKGIYRRALKGEVLKSEHDYLATPDGKGHWVRWEIRPWGHSEEESSGVILFAEDVTEHRVLERQFLQAQKMEAVGQLAGGVAHDFNNLLMVMKSYGRLIGDSASDSKIRKYAEKISEAAEKAAAVTKQLLAFSRKQAQELSLLDINLVVSQFCSMLPNLIGEEIELVVVPSAEPAFAKADRGQLEQIVMNLAVNARDALLEGGRLTIHTESAVLDASYSEQHGESVPPGEYVVLTVTDTGCGMDEETKAHAFEPFFTTKEVGKGSGLGLPMVYGIVKQSNGFLWLDSQLGTGTTFKIYLPRIREGTSDQMAEAFPGIAEEGHETVLVAEDNESLREVIGEYLTSKGYKVLLAKDGIEALQIAETRKEPIHLLLSDVVMPRMRGPELVRRLSGIHAEAKAMYMSGYADLAIEGRSLQHAIVVTKPVDLTALARKIRQALEG
jgi:PAS domain S-box-containing protein